MWVVAWEDIAKSVGGAGSVAEVVVEGCLADAHSGDEALLAGLEVGVNVASKLNVFGDDGVKHRSVFPEVEGSEEGFCAPGGGGVNCFSYNIQIIVDKDTT